jgi:hypothetical protein
MVKWVLSSGYCPIRSIGQTPEGRESPLSPVVHIVRGCIGLMPCR